MHLFPKEHCPNIFDHDVDRRALISFQLLKNLDLTVPVYPETKSIAIFPSYKDRYLLPSPKWQTHFIDNPSAQAPIMRTDRH